MRTTSSVTNTAFPFTDDRVPFILVVGANASAPFERTKDGRGFEHASHREKKHQLLEFAQQLNDEGVPVTVLAAWPGKDRTDMFEIDDLHEALGAFG